MAGDAGSDTGGGGDGGSDAEDGAASEDRREGDALPPLVSARREALGARLAEASGLLLCLDFDGTLAEIVDEPDRATLREDSRRAIERLADRSDVVVAVVSGRALADLRERVELPVDYAGNHGLELFAGGERSVHPGVEERRPALEAVLEELEVALAGLEGVVIEDKGATATVHYRRVPAERTEAVREAVTAAVDGREDLEVTSGKQVLEIRPTVDCDKGEAVRRLAAARDTDHLVMYVGDDTTDEAAFEAIAPNGVAVHVGEDPSTAATLRVPDPDGVADLLAWLAEEGVGHLGSSTETRGGPQE